MNDTGGAALATEQMPYLADHSGLKAFCERWRTLPWLALDTEFIREKTYYPQLCLIQLAGPDPECLACIDPLALSDTQLQPLFELLEDPSITKVFHAGQQDLEIFFQRRERVPAPLFDTQLAAALLGYGEQISYAALVNTELGISLSKSQTRTDWARRPLAAEQIAYALDDVRYLRDLYPQLRERLIKRQRLAWLNDDFAAMAQPDRYRSDPDDAWRRLRGLAKLRGARLACAVLLAAWREREAMRLDKPRRWVLTDDVIMALAQQLPNSAERLRRVRGLNEKTAANYAKPLLEIITTARTMPSAQWPQQLVEQAPATDVAEDALLDAMMALVRLRALENDISPGAIAGRQELGRLLRGNDSELLHGWRAAVAGDALQAMLAGHSQLAVSNGRLQLVTTADAT